VLFNLISNWAIVMIRIRLVIVLTLMMVMMAALINTITLEGYGQQEQHKISSDSLNSTNENSGWLEDFDWEKCNIASKGANNYFILKPGYQLILQGQEVNKIIEMTVTVLNETKMVNGTKLGIVEEKSVEDGEIVEISRNYFGICTETNDVFYFGEDTDWYENGKIVSHEGTWRAGIDNAKPGVIMPGKVVVGLKYYQELAPGLDEGRAEIISVNGTLNTPAGTFKQVLKTEETTPLEPGEKEYKLYAPGIGLIQDNTLKLIKYTQQ
jgi:hypothetical protein